MQARQQPVTPIKFTLRQTPLAILCYFLISVESASALSASNQLLELSIEDLLAVKVTSSTLTEENLHSVPASMTVYTRADIRRLGLTGLGELVNYVPGFQSYRSDNSSLNRNISARGRSVGNSAAEVLILIDGQRLNNDWHGGAGTVESIISLENVERVEFIRGPGSAIYGSNAMTGVINIITQSQRELRLEAGSYQKQYASVQWQTAGDAGALDIYARSTNSDGETQVLYNPTTNSYRSGRDPYRAQDLYLRGNLGEFSLAARYTRRDTQEFYAVGYTDDDAYFDTQTHSVNLGWKHLLTEQLRLDGHVFSSYKFYRGRAAISADGLTVYEGGIVEREQGTQWLLQSETENLRWLLGWEWRNPELINTASHLGTLDAPRAIAPLILQAPENGRRINGIFAQVQFALNDTLDVTTSLRHDDYSDVGGNNSPRVALVQQLNADNSVKLIYSEAFRAPTRLESSVMNQVTVVNNPELRPEIAKTTELIWVHTGQNKLFSTTLFNTQVDDAVIDSIAGTPALKRKPINSDLSIAGLGTEWQQQWQEHWQVRIAFTHFFDSAGEIHTQSNSLFGGSLSYTREKWSATLLANYQGSAVDPNEQNLPADITTTETTYFGGHTVFGLHMNYQFNKDLNLYLHGDNIFNKEYNSPAFRPGNYEGVPGSGRIWTLGAQLSF